MANDQEKEALTVFFQVTVPGIRDMVFSSCEGLESEIDVDMIFDGGSLAPPSTARGLQKVSKVSFSHGTLKGQGGKTLFEWYQDVLNSGKALEKKSLSVAVMDESGKKLDEWRLERAWPCRWVAPLMSKDQSSIAVEYVTFAHEGIVRKQ